MVVRAGRSLTLGDLVAVGRTSEVHRCGDVAAKVLNRGVPAEWAYAEADFTESVRRLGISAPDVLDVTTVDGRPTIVFTFVEGPSMWAAMRKPGADVQGLVAELVEVQRVIHASGVPDDLPSLASRLRMKLDASAELESDERQEAHRLLSTLPSGSALLHGDLHPGNVLLGRDGPVVIDWFDATVGHPVADIARSSLLLQPGGEIDLLHLPGATGELVAAVAHTYRDLSGVAEDHAEFRAWLRLVAASRLSEGADADAAGLLSIWRRT